VTSPSESITRLYLNSFEGKIGAVQLREKVLARLRADHSWEVVDNPSEADAFLNGSGEMWLQGYVVVNARSKTRQAVYGGYLSLELKNKSGDTLWSYLVTPGGWHWNGADSDMADHIVRLMDRSAIEGKIPTNSSGTVGIHLSIVGAGSTFSAPLYQKWIESFEMSHPGIRISYQVVGSAKGIEAVREGKVDFGASDAPLSDEEIATLPAKISQYATVLGGVVVAYNLKGTSQDLKFTPEVLAGIYLGRITRWNDQKLREINPGTRLPDEKITAFHRSDGSGTSFAWTDFLSQTSTEWKDSVGRGLKLQWPTGEGADGNERVAAKVAETPGAIGYMELTYALRYRLSFGMIRNAAGKFVQANLISLGAAAKSIPQTGDLRNSTANSPGKDAYPITTFTWILVPESGENPEKASTIRDLVRWMLTSGQKECAGLGYLPLPKEVAQTELRQLGSPSH
jgi:phosphate ABC transporter phosphate-binding protein